MEKITLKELAPYLPYGLKGIYRLQEVTPNAPNEIREKILASDSVDFFLKYATPILRPLSDLTKEIEQIKERLFGDTEIDNYNYLGVVNHAHAFNLDGKKVGILAMPYFFIDELIKNHYDVFGLIEKGLAIDKNSLTASTPQR